MVTESRNSPTSTNWDEEDLFTTKDLTQGMKSIDNGIVGCQDPCTSLEALAKGTSTKCSETTPVVLKSVAHKTQTKPQSSLLLTPGPPVDGEPCECKQEVADSIMTAGCTNRMVKLAEPAEIADVNRTPMLGRELATRDCGVDEGDGMEHKDLRLPKAELYCKERHQCNENTMDDVPIAHGVPLEGKWTWSVSGEVSNPKGSENASNAAIKHVDGSCEHPRLADIDGVVSEGCKGSMDKPTELLMMSVEPYVEDGSGMPSVYLGGTHWRAGDTSCPEGQSDRVRRTDRKRRRTLRACQMVVQQLL